MAFETSGGGFQPHKDYRGFVPAPQFYAALIAKGFTPNAARGILGNVMHESGGGGRGGVYLDPPTDAGHLNWGTGDAAVGAVQWEGRRQSGVAPTLQSQVDKIWDEFNNPGSAGMPAGSFQRLQMAQSPGEAASFVNTTYERPLKPAASAAQRQQFAYFPFHDGGTQPAAATASASAPGTTLTSLPEGVVDPSILARGGFSPPIGSSGTSTASTPATAAPTASTPATAAPTTFASAIANGDVGGALKALTTPKTTTDAKGATTTGESPLEKVGDILSNKQDGKAPVIPEMPKMQPVQDPNANLAPAAQQLFQTVQANAAKPLSWSNRPFGYGAGPQAPQIGTTLNSMGYPYG